MYVKRYAQCLILDIFNCIFGRTSTKWKTISDSTFVALLAISLISLGAGLGFSLLPARNKLKVDNKKFTPPSHILNNFKNPNWAHFGSIFCDISHFTSQGTFFLEIFGMLLRNVP